MRIEQKVISEIYDVFAVEQLTRSTSLEENTAVDRLQIQANQKSQIHRHNFSDTILFIASGNGEVTVGALRPKKFALAKPKLII